MIKLFCFCCCLALVIDSQQSAQAQALNVFVNNYSFLSASTDTPYVETCIAIPGNEIAFIKKANGKFEGQLDITLLYWKDTLVIGYDKYILHTPEITDSSNINFDVTDLRRFSLSNGEYTLEVRATDVNRIQTAARIYKGLKIDFNSTNTIVSSIELVQQFAATSEKNNFSKNGFDIHPLAVPYFSTDMNKLTFYTEVYNADKTVPNEDIILTYSIKHAQSNEVANDLYRWTKQHAGPVNILFSELDITELPTGNYYVLVEAKSKKNQVLSSQMEYFQRSNKNSVSNWSSIELIDVSDKFVRALPNDSMPYFLRSVAPRAEMYERDYITRTAYGTDTLLMKKFFYNFWQKRNADDPYLEWLKYRQYLSYVEYNYKTPVGYGFESDRGRIYLQYGPPNHIEEEEHESGAYPYEIWQYYKLTNNQTNIKFVFCNFELAANEYKLIHSDAKGELNDPRWKFKVYKSFKDGNGNSNFDQEDFRDVHGSQVDQLYNR